MGWSRADSKDLSSFFSLFGRGAVSESAIYLLRYVEAVLESNGSSGELVGKKQKKVCNRGSTWLNK